MKDNEPDFLNLNTRSDKVAFTAQLLVGAALAAYIGNIANELAIQDYQTHAKFTRVAVEWGVSCAGFTTTIGCGYEAVQLWRRKITHS